MPPQKGYRHTEEHNKAISLGRIKRFAEMTDEEKAERKAANKAKRDLMKQLYNEYIFRKLRIK